MEQVQEETSMERFIFMILAIVAGVIIAISIYLIIRSKTRQKKPSGINVVEMHSQSPSSENIDNNKQDIVNRNLIRRDTEEMYRRRTEAKEEKKTRRTRDEGEMYRCNNEVKQWLEDVVGFPQYYDLFMKEGLDSLRVIRKVENVNNLADIGIEKAGHQTLIMNYIQKLQDKSGENNIAPDIVVRTAFV